MTQPHQYEHGCLAQRLNAEPAIFRGASLSELIALCISGVCITVPLMLALCAAMGVIMMGVGLGVFSTLAWVYWGSGLLKRAKLGRPKGYYALKVRLILEDLGLIKSQLIRHSGHWRVGGRS